MTCDEVRASFSDLYDGAMSSADLAHLRQHLQGCPACRAEWNTFQRAMQAVTDLGRAEPSPGFAARVRERLEAPPLWRRALRWLFLPLYVKVPLQTAALVLVAFAGLLLFQRSPELGRELESFKAVSPPVARELPAPAAPPRAAQPVEKPKPPRPRAEPSRPIPLPEARVEKEGEAGISVLRDEAKKLEKAPPPSLAPKSEEAPQEPRAQTKERAFAPRRVLPPVPAPPLAPAPSAPAVQAPALQSAPVPTRAKESQVSSIPSGSADQLYSNAVTDLNRQSYDRAIDNLRAFIQQNPKDSRVPDARMRLGDAYLAQQRFREAIPEYEALASEYPDSSLIPSALLRQAQARLALGDQTGCQDLKELINRHPQVPEAAVARETLSARCP
jgi:tol-pal system protein YbgF